MSGPNSTIGETPIYSGSDRNIDIDIDIDRLSSKKLRIQVATTESPAIPKRNQDAGFNISKLSLILLIRESPISGKVSPRK